MRLATCNGEGFPYLLHFQFHIFHIHINIRVYMIFFFEREKVKNGSTTHINWKMKWRDQIHVCSCSGYYWKWMMKSWGWYLSLRFRRGSFSSIIVSIRCKLWTEKTLEIENSVYVCFIYFHFLYFSPIIFCRFKHDSLFPVVIWIFSVWVDNSSLML